MQISFFVQATHIIFDSQSPTLSTALRLPEKVIRKALDTPDDTHGEASLPVVRLSESGEILHGLLTFILPVTPLMPLTTEKAMELLSVAQKYQMASVRAHIRDKIAQRNPPSTYRDTALYMHSLARKNGLHREALQAAQTILKYRMKKVRSILTSDLTDFRSSGAHGTLTGLHCVELGSSQIPRWPDDYTASIGDAPNLFDLIEFNVALARHIGDG